MCQGARATSVRSLHRMCGPVQLAGGDDEEMRDRLRGLGC
jgi:hypothetical protein